MSTSPIPPEAESAPRNAHLTGEQQSTVHALYRRLLEHIRDGSTLVPAQCITYGFEAIHPPPQNETGVYEEIAVIFCHELIEMTKEMHASTGSLTSLKTLQFLKFIQIAFFSAQISDVTDFLSDIELLKFTRAFTQIPCTHLDIGKHATTKVIERLGTINPAEIPTLIDALDALPQSERLDLAQLFPNLFRDLEMRSADHVAAQMPKTVQTTDDTRQQAISVMARVMNRLQRGSKSALEEIALVNAQNNSLRELQASVRPEGLQNRIHEKTMQDANATHEHLAKRMHLNTVVQKNERIVTIGNNAVGIMGPTGVIRDIGLCDHRKLKQEAPFSTTVLQDVRNRLHLGMTNSLFFEMVDEGILSSISTDTTRQEFWAKVFPDLREGELTECLTAIEKERTARKNGASSLLVEAENNISARVESMNRSTDAIAVMMDQIRQDTFFQQFDVYLERFDFYQNVEIPSLLGEDAQEKKKGIPHQAMQAIDCLILAVEQQMHTVERIAETVPSAVTVPETSAILTRLKEIRDKAYAEDRTLASAFRMRQSEESAKYQESMSESTTALSTLNRELRKPNGNVLLQTTFDDLDATYLDTLPSVDVQPTEKFLRDTRFYPFQASEQDEEIKTFALLHNPEMRRSLEEQLGISYDDLSLQSLFQLGRFLRQKRPKDFLDMRIVLHAQRLPPHEPDARTNMLTSFLACSEDLELGNTILELGKFDCADPVFKAYATLVTNAEETAQALAQEQKNRNPQSTISQHNLYRQLLQRGNQLLLHTADLLHTAEKTSENIMDAARALEAESGRVSSARMFFIHATTLLRSGRAIDLRSCAEEQEFVLEALHASGGNASLLRALHEKHALEPIPEIFWRVDRTAEEYNERFGFDVTKFLANHTSDKQQLLVEFGPGNGTFKNSRADTTKGYLDLAICDRVYYPVSTLIRNIIDFNILANDGVNLTNQQEAELCDILYHTVTTEGGKNDDATLEALRKDPRNITNILVAKSPQFQKALSTSFETAGALLSTNVAKYLRTSKPDFDVFEAVPAYPAGTILGDFSDIEHLADHQINAALGARSTVYKENDAYISFMSSMTTKLTEDGLYVDDNIRENFGHRYRFAELQIIERQTGYPLMIIMGPQLEGNDLGETPEPRAIVMTQSSSKLMYIRSNLSPGFSIRSLSEILADSAYMEILATKGRIEQSDFQAT